MTFPDGCKIPAVDDHCACFEAEFRCSLEEPCHRHDPEMHDPEDDSLYGRRHRETMLSVDRT
jgi:hypothetical protein